MINAAKNIAKKILPKKAYLSLARTLKRPPKINYYSQAELSARAKQFSLKEISVIWDGRTDISPLFSLPNLKISAVYSFDLDLIGTVFRGYAVKTLKPGAPVDTDGWIVSALNETAGFSLNRHLLRTGREKQIVLQHVKYQNGTRYYSYIDFFTNEQTTVVQINNYFRRCYALSFPLDIRLTLRDCSGKVMETSQVIIPPDALRVVRSEDFKARNFVGYLEVEFEIAKKITPFLHYMADYSSKDFISSNHQSGLGLNPAHCAFTRGYIPTEKDRTLFVCLFQHNYEKPVVIQAILKYTDGDGKLVTKTKDFKPLGKKEMQYTDMKELFGEVDFSKAHSPTVIIDAPVPLHRPNFYYAVKGREGYYDTSHSSPDLKFVVETVYKGNPVITEEEKRKMDDAGITPFELVHQVLPTKIGLDSIFALGNDTTAPMADFHIELYDQQGRLKGELEDSFDFENERYINLNDYASEKGFKDFVGTVSFKPVKGASRIPVNMTNVAGYEKRGTHLSTTTAGTGSNPDNIPFYFRGGPPNYLRLKCSAGTTDIFARGRASDDYDTMYVVSYASADRNLKAAARYEVQIVNFDGEKKIAYRTINPHGFDLFRLSDMVRETGHQSKGGFYTVWIFSADAHFEAWHILERKKDGAIALEHLYAGRFGL